MVYADFLTKGINYYHQKHMDTEEKIFCQKMIEIEEIINRVLAETNPLAYKTIHPPELEVNDGLKELIEKAKLYT